MGEQTGPLGTGKSEGLGWPPRGLLWALAFAVIYIVAFQLNRLFDPLFLVIESKVSMIFLPAFVRVAAVLVAGLAGAMGLFAGAMVLGFMQELAPLDSPENNKTNQNGQYGPEERPTSFKEGHLAGNLNESLIGLEHIPTTKRTSNTKNGEETGKDFSQAFHISFFETLA